MDIVDDLKNLSNALSVMGITLPTDSADPLEAADLIESLRSRAEKAEAEAATSHAAWKVCNDARNASRLRAEAAEATCEKLAKALDQCQKALASMIDPSSIAQTTVIYAFATATTAEATARHVLAAYRKEASE